MRHNPGGRSRSAGRSGRSGRGRAVAVAARTPGRSLRSCSQWGHRAPSPGLRCHLALRLRRHGGRGGVDLEKVAGGCIPGRCTAQPGSNGEKVSPPGLLGARMIRLSTGFRRIWDLGPERSICYLYGPSSPAGDVGKLGNAVLGTGEICRSGWLYLLTVQANGRTATPSAALLWVSLRPAGLRQP